MCSLEVPRIWNHQPLLNYPGFQRLFMRGFRFRSSLKKWPARKASGPERHSFHSAEPITTLRTPKHPGCFADWILGDIECFKCSDWIIITIGACSGRGCFPFFPARHHFRAPYTFASSPLSESLEQANWEVLARRILIFCSSFLVGMICLLMRVDSIYFDLFWNENFFIAAK